MGEAPFRSERDAALARVDELERGDRALRERIAALERELVVRRPWRHSLVGAFATVAVFLVVVMGIAVLVIGCFSARWVGGRLG